jgi:hypothetical protein
MEYGVGADTLCVGYRGNGMRKLLVLALVGMSGVAMAKKPAASSTVKTEDCGAMLKSLEPLPTKFAELMTAVATNLDAHVAMLATSKDPSAQAEAAMFKKLADDHRALSAAASKAAADMDAGSKLAPAPHDMSKMDPAAMSAAMLKEATLSREMAALMVKDAEQTEKMVQTMKAAPQHASK